jgi:hypothetical protein
MGASWKARAARARSAVKEENPGSLGESTLKAQVMKIINDDSKHIHDVVCEYFDSASASPEDKALPTYFTFSLPHWECNGQCQDSVARVRIRTYKTGQKCEV